MTRAEYNAKLQDVQRMEIAAGFAILTPFRTVDEKSGRIVDCGYSHHNRTIFRQTDPFTPHSTFYVDEQLLGRIMYADASR